MGTLWTPGGEHPVGRPSGPGSPGPGPTGSGGSPDGPPGGSDEGQPGGADDEALASQLAAMRDELAHAPAEVVVANHCYGLFELAAVYLSQQPARLLDARLAIDALASLVDGLTGRLGDAENQLRDGLSQLQLAYVQIDGAQRAGADVASGAAANGDAATGDRAGEGTDTGDRPAGTGEGGARPEPSDPGG